MHPVIAGGDGRSPTSQGPCIISSESSTSITRQMRTDKRDQPFIQPVADKNYRKTMLEIQNISDTEPERRTVELNLYNNSSSFFTVSLNNFM